VKNNNKFALQRGFFFTANQKCLPTRCVIIMTKLHVYETARAVQMGLFTGKNKKRRKEEELAKKYTLFRERRGEKKRRK
jgi:hypothetical protein